MITFDNLRQVIEMIIQPFVDYISLFLKKYQLNEQYLSQQQALDADRKPIQYINFTGFYLDVNATIFFIIKETKEIILGFSQRHRENIVNLFSFNVKSI